jgi:hypothetical protein
MRRWTAAVVFLSALYSAVFVLVPTRALTLFMDDWLLLQREVVTPWPRRWAAMINEHWSPISLAVIDLERVLFGVHAFPYLVVSWAFHVANVFLLARLVRERTGDERVAALAAAAFGLSTAYREALWFLAPIYLILGLTTSILGFLALERHRREGGRASLALVAASTFAAPLAFGGGLVLAPALAAEALLLDAGAARRRVIAAAFAGLGAYLALYALFAIPDAYFLAKNAQSFALAARYAVDFVGAGMVGTFFLGPVGGEAHAGPVLAATYAVAVSALALFLPRPERRRLLAAQVHLLLIVLPVAATRWWFRNPTQSRYEYLLVIPWTTTLAFALAASRRRFPRLDLAAGLVLALLAVGHARAAADDRSAYAPATRAGDRALVDRLVAVLPAAAKAGAPLYDAPLPPSLGLKGTRVSHLMDVAGRSGTILWTRSRTRETVAPYLGDPLLRPLLLDESEPR